MLFSNVNACWQTWISQQYGTCVLYRGNFSQLVLWQKMINYSELLWATSKLRKFTTNMHFYLFPSPSGTKLRQAKTPAERHEMLRRFPAIIIHFILILFSNQLTNLEMSFTADKCLTVQLNPPLSLPLKGGFLSRHWIAYNRYWTVNLNWKLGSLCLIDFRPQKPNDVLVERNISKDINNYES